MLICCLIYTFDQSGSVPTNTATAVLYASIALTGEQAFVLLEQAVKKLIATQEIDAEVLWTLRYEQNSKAATPAAADDSIDVLRFPNTPLDLSFDDTILDNVKEGWLKITGSNADEFMKFEDRQEAADEDVQDDE